MDQGPSQTTPTNVGEVACPGVFYPTHSGDGVLSRIRTPGGLITSAQCRYVADVADRFAGGTVTITNRANIQLRALADRLPLDVVGQLQEIGLAGAEPAVDHLRNIMASPTAGLDDAALADTRPLVWALDRYIATHPDLAPLPAKLSFGFDGGERASIAHLPNDVLFRADCAAAGEARFRVVLRVGAGDGESVDLGFALQSDQVVQVAAEIAEMYLGLLPADGSKPRLRHLLADYSLQAIQRLLFERLPALTNDGPASPHTTRMDVRAPIGVHAQRHNRGEGMTYVGLAPLVAGRLLSTQLRRLADLSERYGSGSLRLSPWRNVLLPDITPESVDVVQAELERAGLPCRAPSLASGIVACAGSAGCAAGLADTVRDATALSVRLAGIAPASGPINIHLSGCEKCCAQRRPADITLLGRPGDGERYALYVRGDGNGRLGRLLVDPLAPDDALELVARLAAEAMSSPLHR